MQRSARSAPGVAGAEESETAGSPESAARLHQHNGDLMAVTH